MSAMGDSNCYLKKESCTLLEAVCKAHPKAAKLQGEKVVTMALDCLSHKHSVIRIAGVKVTTALLPF
jgi:hypothetical protein